MYNEDNDMSYENQNGIYGNDGRAASEQAQPSAEQAQMSGEQAQMYGSRDQAAGDQAQACGSQAAGNCRFAGNGPAAGNGQGYQGYQNQPSGSQAAGNGQPSWNGQNYQGYGEPDQKKGRKGRKPSVVKKAVGVAAAALLFGVIAGGTIAGINILADSVKPEKPTETQAQTRVALSDEDIDRIKKDIAVDVSNVQSMDVSDIVEEAMPSVVAINNTMLYQSNNLWFGSQTYEVPSSGSGIIIGKNDTELLIVSNNHVVENTTDLSVVFIDGTALAGTVKGTDEETDLAVVAVPLDTIPAETMSKISVAELGNSDELKVGQGVIAIGNSLGYGQSVTVGYVSALDREIKTSDSKTRKLLQTDAAINPGNSGGALLNMKGQVIGINAAKYASTDVEGVGYAIPISQAEDIINSLMVRRSGDQVEEGKEGYLGIQGVSVDDDMVQKLGMPEGVYVYKILDGGAASRTDLREKDVITGFDGQTIRSMASLQNLLKYYEAGETVELKVQSLENGQYVERTISITLAKQVDTD